jgi:hypothetical protein
MDLLLDFVANSETEPWLEHPEGGPNASLNSGQME